MDTQITPDTTTYQTERPNGGAMAAFVAAGFGSFAMGLFVLLHEAGVYSAPSLHDGAGGLSGRSTFAVVAWLVAWALLHRAWRDRDISASRTLWVTLALTGIGILLTFPPFWSVL
ncbi:MAG: hypothetical protein ACYC28_03230 [Longimicrobiales bacterium]